MNLFKSPQLPKYVHTVDFPFMSNFSHSFSSEWLILRQIINMPTQLLYPSAFISPGYLSYSPGTQLQGGDADASHRPQPGCLPKYVLSQQAVQQSLLL